MARNARPRRFREFFLHHVGEIQDFANLAAFQLLLFVAYYLARKQCLGRFAAGLTQDLLLPFPFLFSLLLFLHVSFSFPCCFCPFLRASQSFFLCFPFQVPFLSYFFESMFSFPKNL